MDGQPFMRRKDREALRERWLLRAAKAFERMFGEAHQGQLITLTEREDMACLLGDELKAFLLEEHAACDSQVRPAQAACPKCHKPAERVIKKQGANKETLPERELTTRAGEIKLRREQWRCKACRRVFFSAGPQVEAGGGEVQSAPAGEGGPAGEQGGVV